MSGLIGNLKDVIVLIVLFSVTIFVHELGHFLVALRCGMAVDTFSIGFGPAIWSRKRRGIVYKIGAIPFGGYVALPQLDPSGMAAVQGGGGDRADDAGERPPLPAISPWKKILVSVAGAVGNAILALLLALTIWLAPQAVTYKGSTVVGAVTPDSTADKAGLSPGDAIVAVNGKHVETWYDYSMECLLIGVSKTVTLTVVSDGKKREVEAPLVKGPTEVPVIEGLTRKSIPCLFARVLPDGAAAKAGLKAGDVVVRFDGLEVDGADHFRELADARGGRAVPITVDRRGRAITVSVTPAFNKEAGRAIIGVIPEDVIMPWMQEKKPLAQLKSDAMGIVRLLKALVTPGESKNAAKGLGGPVAIFATLWISIKISMFNAVGFLRFLNVNLAMLNLLPIPVLDGGHIMFFLWEGVTRRKVHPTVVNTLINVFVVLLIVVFCVLTFRDVDRFVPGVTRLFKHGKATAADTNDSPARADAPAVEPAAP